MISATPSVFDASLSQSDGEGIDAYVERHAPGVGYSYYGAGKVALRDGLDGLVEPGGNVLVPAYLSPAVVEPFRELGLEPRFYALEPSLDPDFADLESRLDEDTVAVTSVNYFGFPQPGLERLADLTDEYGCYHVDDNAHGPISVADGRLLGTHGDLGITTLRKLLPVPDGAVLYRASDEVEAAFEPSSLAGRADRFGADDCRYLATSVAETALDPLYRSIESFLDDDDVSSVDPIARYEAAKAPMSKLSAAVTDAADPDAIRAARRENFRAWGRVLADRDDLAPLYEELPTGISPYEYPVLADDSSSFLADLEDAGVAGAHGWPILRESVRGDDAYETANRYAESVVALPVHQGIEPSAIETVGERLRGRR
ncbi:DegT/DnrJ/EryC1/StrS aminotransferase [Natrinema pellirubrum DSM 15624]|uniref:DegT/DnrJ/EryC1/StrS aminotransferase n=1 Tax=Natrinema pellirubrum (strain DSM 15624 / CIP 106293 / JCM 10476 / NCIMB 786 / 157) TaxID=797303 RepID=L0JKS3_NATP1|nr:DegT/DnrJ/EryC1/StrS family aminotransferase [Natrinema pellirubrum]AGB31182.1 putative PLP-dependent enzyme possibly involved in cell wall biogenesis [Natrinema pellirubrum DSM 15624]ELY81454.1 DegT/DnrJ/EryC1/StrS aminotransferase [Natrinema pellirubrum DSM 15624]